MAFSFQVSSLQGGLIRTVIIIIIAVIILGALGINIRGVVESPLVQENLQYVWGLVEKVWGLYLEEPLVYVWNTFLAPLLNADAPMAPDAIPE